MCRNELGLREDFRPSAGEHRGLVAALDVPGFPPILVATVYLESGAPLTGQSAEVLAQIGARLTEFNG